MMLSSMFTRMLPGEGDKDTVTRAPCHPGALGARAGCRLGVPLAILLQRMMPELGKEREGRGDRQGESPPPAPSISFARSLLEENKTSILRTSSLGKRISEVVPPKPFAFSPGKLQPR